MGFPRVRYGGEKTKCRAGALLLLLCAVLAVAAAAAPLSAYSGGYDSANLDYDCGGSGSCHVDASTAGIEMFSTANLLEPGARVMIEVRVTGGEAPGYPLGVMILSSYARSNSMPSDDGWTILADPSGISTYNYYELPKYTGSASLSWVLSAPAEPGIYTLLAREMHGNGGKFATDVETGLTFMVALPQTQCVPAIIVTAPEENSTVSGDVTVEATIASTQQIRYAVLRIDGEVVGNKSSEPFNWTIDTTALADGPHEVNISAVDADGHTGFDEFIITVSNAEPVPDPDPPFDPAPSDDEELWSMTAWVGTMVAGGAAIAAFAGILIFAGMMTHLKNDKAGRK